ncbi:MAG: hypothetical protein EU541_04685 [Promethearchaeota archaeon]|nr:MAG: hypothetical protein EU541_04685 [Candidatus Lokiarchaeota archaeon]
MDSKTEKKIKGKIGQVYTPESVAQFMLSRVIYYFKKINKDLKYVKVLEPCSGDGIFLKMLLQFGFSDITAFELDDTLSSKLLEKYPEVHFRFENVLGADLNDKFDLIIGNPPYLGQNYNADLFQDYCKRFKFCKKYFVGNMDLFYYFIHKAIEDLNPEGFLCFITTNYWITKSEKTGIKYLKPHILRECIIREYIDISKLQIFPDAPGQHNCIFILQKKNPKKKSSNKDQRINIIQVESKTSEFSSHQKFNYRVLQKIINNEPSPYYKRYQSALSNKDLQGNKSWNLLYPKWIKQLVEQIERYSIKEGKKQYLKDLFIIRNGLIFITDQIFVLEEGNQIKTEKENFFIKIKDKYVKLLDCEVERLKKLYKSSAITRYGFYKDDFEGYAIYFNKQKVLLDEPKDLAAYFSKCYPNLTKYLHQFTPKLKQKLKNAKENPYHIYFPRRGDRVKDSQLLVDLEPLYENARKIFFPYISNTNVFGYAESNYFATSDTYFLWPKNKSSYINYHFLIAYLNSNIVQFLFKAKNIKIKRSKTKLEHAIPIPNLKLFQSEDKKSIIKTISFLSSKMTEWNLDLNKTGANIISLNSLEEQINIIPFLEMKQLKSILNKKDQLAVQKKLNVLFYHLFEINPKIISSTIN